jgi:hypothetical protein
MSLADKLKALLKITSLTKTITSISTSEGKNDATEASFITLNWDNSHSWQVASASIASFNQTHSH